MHGNHEKPLSNKRLYTKTDLYIQNDATKFIVNAYIL